MTGKRDPLLVTEPPVYSTLHCTECFGPDPTTGTMRQTGETVGAYDRWRCVECGRETLASTPAPRAEADR